MARQRHPGKNERLWSAPYPTPNLHQSGYFHPLRSRLGMLSWHKHITYASVGLSVNVVKKMRRK